jgi:hypothetical protein
MRPLLVLIALLDLLAVAAPLHAETHRLIPTTFASTFSGTETPALRLKSGDRVMTTTVDDQGLDAQGKTVAQGPNPQTGPVLHRRR